MKTEKKIPFVLDTFKSGKSLRVETRDGREVEILKTDLDNEHSMIYTIGKKTAEQCGIFGRYHDSSVDSSNDLFLVVESMETVRYFNVYRDKTTRIGGETDSLEKTDSLPSATDAINRIKLTIDEKGEVSVENLGLPEAAVEEDEVSVSYNNVYLWGTSSGVGSIETCKLFRGNPIDRQKTTITNGKAKVELIGLDATE